MCCAGKRAIDVAAFNLQFFAANEFFGSSSGMGSALIRKIDERRLRLIRDSNKRSRVSGLLESFGENNPEMLSDVMNFRLLQAHADLARRTFLRQILKIQ